MNSTRGPVILGMATPEHGGAAVAAAIEVAAREAVRRRVDLRLVYGHETLPTWNYAGELLADVVASATEAFPDLAVTTAIYPGSAETALIAASSTASLVVLSADTSLHDDDVIASLVSTPAITRAPVLVVVATPIPAPGQQATPERESVFV